MADAKIVNIKGVQWDLKDEVARNEITTLKTEIETLRAVEKWEYKIPQYGGEIVARRQGNVVNIIATKIGETNKIPSSVGNIDFAILPERFRPSNECFYMMRTAGSYVTQHGGMINPNGAINYYTYTEVSYGYFSVSYIVD